MAESGSGVNFNNRDESSETESEYSDVDEESTLNDDLDVRVLIAIYGQTNP